MDTNENDVDMDLLVDNNPDPREDYLDEHNKEVVEQNPDPDKVIEADLEMDPAAATEELERKKSLIRLGINPYTRSQEFMEVIDKKFDESSYRTWDAYHNSPADKYARENSNKMFTETVRPVTMKDYESNKTAFDSFIFGKRLFDFKNKYLQSDIDKKVVCHISDKYYGTVSMDIQFKKKGEVTSTACVYALLWINGKAQGAPIVPLMTCYDGCGADYTSSESYRRAYSMEKAFGYFKDKDFKNDPKNKNVHKYKAINTIQEFFNMPIVREKIGEFKKDIKADGYIPATMDEVKNLKSTFFNKFMRGTTGSSTSNIVYNYVKKEDVVWAYWTFSALTRTCLSVVGLVKTPKGKLTSIGFAINVPFRATADVHDIDESKESFNFETGSFN